MDDFSLPTLERLAVGDPFIVRAVHPPTDAPEWQAWLEEIGFLYGEHGMLMARGAPGGDPLVVRIGASTFALRRAEAGCIRVETATAELPTGQAS